MPEFEIRGPDGKTYEIIAPDKASAVAAFNRKIGKPVDLPKGERFKQGLTDIAQGVMQLGAHAGPSVTPPPPPGMDAWPSDVSPAIQPGLDQQADQAIADQQRGYQERREAAGGSGVDWMRLGGNVTATLPMALAGPNPATLGGAMGAGTLTGAGASMLSPVTDPNANFIAEKGKQAAIGATVGAVMGPAANLTSRVVAPNVNKAANYLIGKGVIPTPGQMLGPTAAKLEDRLTSLPLFGNAIAAAQKRGLDQYNKAVLDDVVAPLGIKAPSKIGYDGIDAVHEVIGKSYDELLPNLVFKVDDQLMADLGNLSSMAAEMPKEQAARFNDIVVKKFIGRLSETDMMDGNAFKGVESELSRIAKELRSDASFDNRELGAAVREVLVAVRKNLERSNPMFAGRLGKINQAFSNLVRAENAASRLGTEDGVFTPSQFMAAVRTSDSSIRKSKFARGEAAMQDVARAGKTVLSQKYPDSGTVGRSIPAALLMGGLATKDIVTTGGALTAGALAYTPGVQRFIVDLMNRHGPKSEIVRNVLQRLTAPSAAGGALAVEKP